MTQECDVLVIGGGPAGSTISHVLTERGHHVVLLEKDHHPRFHIGESLLPMNIPILERLGILEEVKAMGVVKNAADFSTPAFEDGTFTFYFNRAKDETNPSAFQVRRSEFDHLLLNKTRAVGTEVHEGVRVTEVDIQPHQRSAIKAVDEDGAERMWRPRFVVDASGRDTLLSSKFQHKRKNPNHHSCAIFGHFNNVVRRTGRDEGNISVYWFDHGWFWLIPLKEGTTSVGAVCWPEYLKSRKKPLDEFLWDSIRLCPPLHQRMENSQLLNEVTATGNYSYTSTKMYGDGYLMIGDAFAFLDPVFSSGVFLAMSGALSGADAVEAYLRNPAEGLAAMEAQERRMRKGISIFSWFIYRFTSPVMRKLFLSPKKTRRIEAAVISVLAGDFYGDTDLTRELWMFKFWYYTFYLLNFPGQWASYLRRKRNVKEAFEQGTLSVDDRSAPA